VIQFYISELKFPVDIKENIVVFLQVQGRHLYQFISAICPVRIMLFFNDKEVEALLKTVLLVYLQNNQKEVIALSKVAKKTLRQFSPLL
jgi:hypothetical protein